MSDATQILLAIEQGDPNSADELLPLVYDELRKLAAARLAMEEPGQTLQPTALVHEAYVRLVKEDRAQLWDSRRHFFSAAAEAMRRILVERARRKLRQKHGGGLRRVDQVHDLANVGAANSSQLLAINEALDRLHAEDPAKAELVKLRYFAGMSLKEAAHALGISRATASRHWTFAKAWLYRALDESENRSEDSGDISWTAPL